MRWKRKTDSNVGFADESGRRSAAVIESGYSQEETFAGPLKNALIDHPQPCGLKLLNLVSIKHLTGSEAPPCLRQPECTNF